ncbi:MAG: hypothetical protein JXQ75_06340 [Phycisphaerae bacterium]|nr:hypothetical protein [Phycisphaerae bacterium]
MPQLEAWEKVLISAAFASSTHGAVGCRTCHGGADGVLEKDAAHEGLVVDPSDGDAPACKGCHADTAAHVQKSLHATQNGYFTAFAARSDKGADDATYRAMFDSRCAECHGTCGQCHVSRPVAVEGGLTNGHAFNKTPSQTENCTACHGSRVGDEFRGRNTGIDADAHYLAGKNCMSCHTGTELHGDGTTPENRFANDAGPHCTDCHTDAESASSANTWHSTHGGKVACQVCHSQSYKNCYQCHVEQDAQSLRFPSEMDFRIGLNPAKTAERPYDYVVLRHVPIAPDTFESWNIELPNYDDEPTWRLATPHNIKKNTSQTESCDNCHDGEAFKDWFLTTAYINGKIGNEADKAMVADEIEANKPVVVDLAPEK